MRTPYPASLTWRKSSFTDENDCVELAWPAGSGAVRDSKNPSPTLVIDQAGLVAFLASLKAAQ